MRIIGQVLVVCSVGAFFCGDAVGAEWISPSATNGCDTAAFVRRFVNAKTVTSAVWRVSGLGVFEAYVNGAIANDAFLKPGYTEPSKCKHAYSSDVTALLDCRNGATNVLSALVTSGWWRGGLLRYGRESAFWGELTLSFEDGSRQVLVTDASWRAAHTGPVTKAGIYYGEDYDARIDVSWMRHGEVAWPHAVVNGEFAGEIRDLPCEPVVLRHDLAMRPVEMHLADGRAVGGGEIVLSPGETLVVDFGQNAAAVPSFRVSGTAGTCLTVLTAEMLNEANGDPARGNDGPGGTLYRANLRGIRAGVRYVLRDGAQSYRPGFTYFGYRYVSFSADRRIVLSQIVSVPVSSVSAQMETGRIETGDERINRLVSNVRWGMLSNYLSIPTDCPQRDERLGWTADTLVFMETGMYLADVQKFLRKYLADLRDAQREDGLYPVVAPTSRHKQIVKGASTGWADAGVMIPYRLWKRYGDLDVVREGWPSMVRYMDYLDAHEGPDQHDNGDWLSMEHLDPNPPWRNMTQSVKYKKGLALVYWIWDAMLMREMAEALGRADDAARFAALEGRVRGLFAARYLGEDGMVKDYWKGQCFDLFALKLGLCANADARAKTRRHLLDDIHAHGDCLQTGFLGTSVIMDVLANEADAPDVAYTLLLQRKFPSWLYSVDQGATTMWERWNSYTKEKGFGPVMMNSFNHYAYGLVVGWLYSTAAGIRADPARPGFREFVLAPLPDRRLGHVTASYRSPAGLIESAWRYAADGTWEWRYVIPEGARAKVVVPGAEPVWRSSGTYHYKGVVK